MFNAVHAPQRGPCEQRGLLQLIYTLRNGGH
jgi:hypothetical protein